MKVHISRGNTKLGSIPSVSLPPVISCPPGVPCRKACYARRAYECYASNTAGLAWRDNWEVWNASPQRYFEEIDSFIRKKKPERFRWHVSGDIPSKVYFENMISIAQRYEQTIFATYTKNLDILADWSFSKGNLPWNLIVMESIWLDGTRNFSAHPAFKVVARPELIPEGVLRCFGNCRECWLCYRQGIQEVYNVLH